MLALGCFVTGPGRGDPALHSRLRAEDDAVAALMLGWAPQEVVGVLPRPLRLWAASVVATYAVVLLGLVHTVLVRPLLAREKRADAASVLEAVRQALAAAPTYSLLFPSLELAAGSGWLRVYDARRDAVALSFAVVGGDGEGGGATRIVCALAVAAAHAAAYFFFVEAGVYLVHRLLHDVPLLYARLHRQHHSFTKSSEMSPLAGFAFEPLDGVAQGASYVVATLLLPAPYLLVKLALFASVLWSFSIHDGLHLGPLLPGFMGAAHHELHHEKFRVNYGQYTSLFDGLFGTLMEPGHIDKHS